MRVDLELPGGPAGLVPGVQRHHPLLADRLALGQDPLGELDLLGIQVAEQPARLGPGLGLGVPRDHVQPDPEPHLAALGLGQTPDPREFFGDLSGRLAPGEVHVDVPGGHRPRRRGRPAEVDAGRRVRRAHHGCLLDLVVLAGEVERIAAPRPAHDRQELAGAGVALVVRQVVAEPGLLVGLAAGHDVEQQPAAGDPLVGGRHLGRERR